MAQNLVKNSGFEQHLPLDCLGCHQDKQNFNAVLKHWHHFSSAPTICDCQYKKNADEELKKKLFCPMDKIKPYQGCNMIELHFAKGCSNWKMEKTGCADQLATKLETPLQIGSVYEISFWLFIPKSSEKHIMKQIGIMLYPNLISNPYHYILEGTQFHIDTVIYDKWYQVKWFVRPTCNLSCLAISIFKTKNISLFEQGYVSDNVALNNYYVDEVAITKLPDDAVVEKTITPFCKFEQNEDFKLEIEGVTCFFNTNDSTILEKDFAQLDSFANRVKQNPNLVFIIQGHTDSVGTNHLTLSQARINSVLDYLEKKHQIAKNRFVSFAEGTKYKAESNQTELGRAKNRRVQIHSLDAELKDVLYRKLLLLLSEKKTDEAAKTLMLWYRLAAQKQYILALFDPRLAPLHKLPDWKFLKKEIEKSYHVFPNKKLAYALDSLWAKDQQPRELHKWIENLSAYFPAVDSAGHFMEVHLEGEFWTEVQIQKADRINYIKLIKLVGKTNFPKESDIGKLQQQAVFLPIIHHKNIAIMQSYLPLIEERCKNGEADWIYYALLFDKIKVKQGLLQLYGTQFKDENFKKLLPNEGMQKVNEARTKIGLVPLATHLF
ncbi:MAG: OmpA family protein [Bacteroidia bacterium]